jgi:aspartyl-tRNA(Asn)/glutamyl-tRNA(Gln) amidotransferase subunit A
VKLPSLNRRNAIAAGISAIAVSACGRSTPFPPEDGAAVADLAALADALHAKKISSLEATFACIARIEKYDSKFNTFITLDRAGAVAAARRADAELAAGKGRGPLHGVPIAIKDNIDVAGLPCTAASAAFVHRQPTDDAEVVRRLRAAGAIILGKLNLHEVAYGATGSISYPRPARNPWDAERITGGSSSGPAAAVAAGFCYGAVGTDTGGSIRIPAAMCGVAGLKPSYGLVSGKGVMPLSETYDHIGPICRSSADIRLMLAAMTGQAVAPSRRALAGLRLGALREPLSYCDTGFSPEVAAAFENALRLAGTIAASIIDARLRAPAPDRIIEAEAYRFHAATAAATPGLYDPRTLASIMDGAAVSDQELAGARAGLLAARANAAGAFREFDLVLIPTVLRTPPTLAEATDPFELTDACTFIFNQLGLPALTLPSGAFADGMPMGLTIAGPPGADGQLLAFAEALEARAGWRRRLRL